jgi:hypothetical protein
VEQHHIDVEQNQQMNQQAEVIQIQQAINNH